jgi:hypothetical protein
MKAMQTAAVLAAVVLSVGAADAQPVLTPGEGVEVRTLKQGSALRAAMEKSLVNGRISESFTITVVTSGLDLDPNASVIDMLEKASRNKDLITDPNNPQEPTGPGGHPMARDTVQVNCATVRNPSGPGYTNATISWHWEYKPNADTNGDGRITNKDSCPCTWSLVQTVIMYTVESEPLMC